MEQTSQAAIAPTSSGRSIATRGRPVGTSLFPSRRGL
jgi:hypothetical protein